MSEGPNENHWEVVCNIPRLKSETWGIRRRSRTSGKGSWSKPVMGLQEYFAKTLCNDANEGKSCFLYQVIAPNGDSLNLVRLAVKG
jgi:hypothetical protein